MTLPCCWAQVVTPTVYSMRDGLPSNNVECIYQDSRGFMWFGTTNGVSRYDGRSFRNYGMADGLPHAFVRKVFEDRLTQGKMWLLAGSHVSTLWKDSVSTYVLPASGVRDLYQDAKGVVWCGTDRGILLIEKDSIRAFRPDKIDMAVHVIQEVGDTLLFAIDLGLIRHVRGTGNFDKIEISSGHDWFISSITSDPVAGVWIVTGDNTIAKLKGTSLGETRQLSYPVGILTTDGKGMLWYASYSGVGKFSLRQFSAAIQTVYTTANGLTENTIRSLFIDREKNVWIGGRDKGVMKLTDLNHVRFPLHNVSLYALTHNLRFATVDSNEHVWVITLKALTEYWSDANGTWSTYAHRLPGLSVASKLYVDSKNRLWVMTSSGDDAARRITRFRINYDVSGHHSLLKKEYDGIPRSGYSVVFLITKDGAIVQGGQGIAYTKIDGNEVRSQSWGAKEGIGINYIRELFEDRDGNIWIGSFRDGVWRMKILPDGRIVLKQFTSPNGLERDGVWTISQDASGDIFVGTQNLGLFTIRGDSAWSMTTREGLLSNTVRDLLFDRSGRLWLAHGFALVRESKPFSRSFQKLSPLVGISPRCLELMRDGRISFVTSTDLYIYNPSPEQRSDSQFPVYITAMKVNGIQRDLQTAFLLPYDENNVEFSFIGLSFIDEKSITYQYRMQGLDTAWSEPSASNSVTYRHLHPGTYRFEVRAIDGRGNRSVTSARIGMEIASPYWSTWWFRAIIGGVLGSIIFYLSRMRVRKFQQKEKIAQEFSHALISQQEVERKRIAQELHDDLGQEFIVISNRARRGMKFSNEEKVHHQLNLIDESATRALASVREIALDLSPSHLGHFGLVSTVRSMIERLMETSSIEISMNIERIDSLLEKATHIHVYRIIQEAMTNVVKHSKATKARVDILRRNGQIEVSVTDDGVGFPSKTVLSEPSTRGGFGLHGLSERVKMLGGNLSLASNPQQGSTVRIIIPISTATENSTILSQNEHAI